MTLPEIIVNRHAVERARDRHGLAIAALDDGEVRELIRGEVRDAIRGGRRSDRKPGSGTSPKRAPKGETFAWTENSERVYVVRQDPGHSRLFVVTVLYAAAF